MYSSRDNVAVFIISYKDRPCLKNVLEQYGQISNLDIYVIDYGSKKLTEVSNFLSKKGITIKIIKVNEDYVTDQKNLACEISRLNYKYSIISDDDVIFSNSQDVNCLIKKMESLPDDVVMLVPKIINVDGSFSIGGFLYKNFTAGSLTEFKGELVFSLLGGGPIFILKNSYLHELETLKIDPFEKILHINNDDVDFGVKIYMRGYKSACLTTVSAIHLGSGSISPKRAYHMYKNRMILLLINTSILHIIKYIPYRILQDVFSSVGRSIKTNNVAYLSSVFRAYLFIMKSIKIVRTLRYARQEMWRKVPHNYLQKIIYRKLPLPINFMDVINT